MVTLSENLLTDEVRPVLVADCARFTHEEVPAKRGLIGLAVKGIFQTLASMKPHFVPSMVDGLIDNWISELEPCWETFGRDGEEDFSVWLAAHRQDVAERLRGVTDGRARATPHATLRKFYERLRPKAQAQVAEAVPGLGRVVGKHLD